MVFLLCWHWRRSPPCAGWRRWYRGKLPGRWCSGLGPQSRESGRAHRETWKTKGEEEVVVEEKGVWCVMTELNKTSNRKNYFGSLAGWVDVAVHRQLIVMSGTARLGLKGPRGQVEVEKTSGARRLIKGSSGLMRDDLCKQCRVRGEQSGNILCD